MITSVTTRALPYVLEADRTSPEAEQTVFHVVPKTPRGSTEAAAAYSKAAIQKRSKGQNRTEIDVKAMMLADVGEWTRAIQRIQRFQVLEGAPEGSYEHFALKAKENPAAYKEVPGGVVVVDTSAEVDIQAIYWCMSPTDIEEVVNAYYNFTQLKEGTKNA